MSAAVCLAAMMPARRADWRGSPFLIFPLLTMRRASRDMRMDPRAIASRSVTGLAPTSTIWTRPRSSTCDRRRDRAFRLLFFGISTRQEKRQALERNRQIDALQLHVRRHVEGAGREVQDRLDAGRHDQVDHVLSRRSRNGDDGDADAITPRGLFEVADVVNRYAIARVLSDLRAEGVEERENLEPFLTESRVIGKRKAQVAGTDDGHPQLAVKSQDLPQVTLEVSHVVADAADAKLAEVCEILADLCGIQVELTRESLGGDRADAGVFKCVQT